MTLLSLSFFVSAALAQSMPHLDGRIETDPGAGLLRGSMCLSKLPQQASLSFLLNRGLNIRGLKDTASGQPLRLKNVGSSGPNVGDATLYSISSSIGAGGFCVEYVGAFPVYRVDIGERSEVDWKGQIAFDGLTVRASEQTRFYPVAVDAATNAPLDTMSYRLEVSCSGCKSIYVNGSAPQAGPKATFFSETPRPLLLYAGNFPYTSFGGIHFAGADVSPGDGETIRSGVKAIAGSHAAYLGVPYLDEPVYLTFAAVARGAQIGESNWAFVTWPTIALAGRIPFSKLLNELDGRRVFSPSMYLAHEMAHYYFGARYSARGPLRWFLLESTAEFIALKTYRTLVGEAAYSATIRSHLKNAGAIDHIVPLDLVESAEQIGEAYRYRLGPLLLCALEQYTSEAVVQRTLAGLVRNPSSKEESYADFRERLVAAGATATALQSFEGECLHKPVASGCLSRLPALKETLP